MEYNGQLGSLRVMGDVASSDSSSNNVSVEIFQTTKVLYQKWNNIVINCDEGYMDVFLNGELVGSISGVVPYMTFDNVVAGENNGILGGICNVSYYDKPLSKSNIKLTYNSFTTIIRQICKYNQITYTSQIKYDKSTYEIVYYIYM